MAQSTREFFESLESRSEVGKAAGLDNSYLFEIEGAGRWVVDAKGGAVSVTEGGEDADCTITTSADTFEQIAAGALNPTAAYMTGKLKVAGDIGAALKLQNLF